MADYNEIEDLRDWFIDTCGEILQKIDLLNGDEPIGTIQDIRANANTAHTALRVLIMHLDELLVQKKRAD